MSTTNHDRHHAAIRGTLARSAGDSPDASVIAEATLNTWRRMADRLAPVIGAHGVDALFSRSLHVTSKTFPWLAMAGNDGSNAALMTDLKARLAGQETTAAAEASHALLVNLTELLTTLIGASLTERLLTPVWLQRYIEVESRLKRVMAVVKVRGSTHNNELRQFEITDEGIVIGDPLPDYEGLLGGQPRRKPIAGTGA